MRCDNCNRWMIPHLSSQRFCCRACSDMWHQSERREAVEWFRACGMKPKLALSAAALRLTPKSRLALGALAILARLTRPRINLATTSTRLNLS
jgi:hypothetical protein